MQSKTPQFDALLDPILESLIPHTRTCTWKGKHEHCEGDFEITNEDIEFLRMLRVPPPSFCPTCRRMRRLVHMGMLRLFKRDCMAPEHAEKMISTFPPDCPFPIYDYKYFIGDAFDPLSFGMEYDPAQSPLSQLLTLRKQFPLPSFLNRDLASTNSDYSSGGRNTKNAYYAGGCFECEDVWYTNFANKSKVVMDSRTIRNSDHVYGSQLCDHLFRVSFAYFSNNCLNSMFLFDCHNCQDCFGCVNLRNKKYCVWNEQLSKEAYEQFLQSVYPLSRTTVAEYEKKFWGLVRTLPMNASHNVGSQNVSGVGIVNSKDVHDIVDAVKAEHVRHADSPLGHHDSMDLLFSGGSDHLYGTTNIGSSSSWVKFSVSSKYCTDSEYIFNCKNVSYCFMCFGLQGKSCCVFNKQYDEKEYFTLVDTIKTALLEQGEYADGLGMEFSAQAYNISLGQIAYPLTDAAIREFGGYVAGEAESNAGDIAVLAKDEIPETIDAVSDDILNGTIRCEETGKPFRIVPTELAFYRDMKLPLPTRHPQVRMEERMHMAPTGKKYTSTCAKCGKTIDSLFDPKEKYLLYCERCYQLEVV